MTSSLDEFPVLISVRVVCRECLLLRELSHINVHINEFLGMGSIREACNRGSLRLMKLIAARGSRASWRNLARIAAKLGHLDILQWLAEFHADRCDWYNVLFLAAASGHLSVVKWLHDNRTEGCSTDAMDWAASHGHLDVVKWLHDNRTEGCSTDAMDGAASQGHLDVVKWLHDNRTEGCTERAMAFVARNGHLDVIKWLHENTAEGCSPYTMDNVTDFDVVKWLHENLYQERLCSTRAIDKAAEMGRLDLVMWLHDNRTEGYTIHAIEVAAQNGYLDMVKWLFHREGDKRRHNCHGWLHCRFCQCGSQRLYSVHYENLNDFILKMARMKGQQHVIEWVESLGEPKSANKWWV